MNIIELNKSEVSAVSGGTCSAAAFAQVVGGLAGTYSMLLIYKMGRGVVVGQTAGAALRSAWDGKGRSAITAGKLYMFIALGCAVFSGIGGIIEYAFSSGDQNK